MSLHVFKNAIVDWVVADSVEDARAVIREQYGHDEFEPGSPAFEFVQLPDDERLTIRDEDDGPETKPCREWTLAGRGLIASTEW